MTQSQSQSQSGRITDTDKLWSIVVTEGRAKVHRNNSPLRCKSVDKSSSPGSSTGQQQEYGFLTGACSKTPKGKHKKMIQVMIFLSQIEFLTKAYLCQPLFRFFYM